jgi:L-aspartate oxidase
MADMEFFQFHPTALNLPGVPAFLISEAVRGDGAVLRNAGGETFMARYDPRLELASRDIVARAIAAELSQTGAVYLDARHLGKTRLRHHFPSIYRFCLSQGLDITEEMIPVAPAAHYFMGGILTGPWGETTLPGLFACGEAASNGVHGANRLASNSLLEGLVFGSRLYDYTTHGPGESLDLDAYRQTTPLSLTEYSLPGFVTAAKGQAMPEMARTRDNLQNLMWQNVGLARTGEGLKQALAQLESWEGNAVPTATNQPDSLKHRAGYELNNLVTVGRLVAGAALVRTESRGAHYRLDFPASREEWQRRVILKKPVTTILSQ